MKRLKSKWKIIVFILLIIIAIVFVNSKRVDSNSPEGTIFQYFKYWNNKDIAGMNSLTTESMQIKDDKNDPLEGVKLLDCTERPDKGYWQEEWYDNPYEYVCVDVSFELHYLDEEDNRLQNWQYYLVKETADSDWKIAMYGVG